MVNISKHSNTTIKIKLNSNSTQALKNVATIYLKKRLYTGAKQFISHQIIILSSTLGDLIYLTVLNKYKKKKFNDNTTIIMCTKQKYFTHVEKFDVC